MFDVIIIGSGFAGAVMAERLAVQQNKNVLIIDRRNHIGGNCYDEKNDYNILIHKYGPHLFHTDSEKVWRYLSKFTDWQIYHHHVMAMIDGQIVPIPFNFNTLHKLFPESLANKFESALLNRYEYNKKIPISELMKVEDSDLKFLAEYIYEKIFLHYTEKQWGISANSINSAVTARVPIFIGRDDRYFNDRFQAVPSKGYTEIFRRMLNHKNIKLMLNTNFHDVMKLEDNKFYFLDSEFHGKIIYTGQLDSLFDNKFGELEYRSVAMNFETLPQENYQQAATVNYPNNYEFTRITEFKKIHPVESRFTTILKEYPQKYVCGKNTPYYPLFNDENKLRYEKYLEESRKVENLIVLGRLAEYKYFDMDDIVLHALETFEKIF